MISCSCHAVNFLPSQVIKESVLGCLLDFLPAAVNRERISNATMKEAYVQKMVKVFNEHDRWSLISLSNNSGKNLELKFVSALRRQFEFSVDSFQIILDRLLESYMQKDSQRKMNKVEVKDQHAENQNKYSPSLLNQTAAPETEKPTDRDIFGEEGAQNSQIKQRDEVQENNSQTEFSQQTVHSNQTKHTALEKDSKEKIPEGLKEVSEHGENLNQTGQTSLSEKKQAPEEAEPPAQIEHEPELLEKTEGSTKVEQLKQAKPCDDLPPAHSNHGELSVQKELANHTKPPDEQKELAEQMGQSEMPKTSNETQGECLNLRESPRSTEQSDKTNVSKSFGEYESSSEEDKTQHVPALHTSTSSHKLADEQNAETEEEIEEERKTDTEICEITENTQGIDCSCSSSSALTLCSTQLPDAQDLLEIDNTQQTENSEKTPNTLDAANPPDTQDILLPPPSLSSDKKTSSAPPCKASERLSHMVVLKHSSPKPPRRMCRKVTPSPNPSSLPENELLVSVPCLESNPHASPEIAFNTEPTASSSNSTATPTSTIPFKTNSEPSPSSNLASDLNFSPAPDPALDIISTSTLNSMSALPQDPPVSQLATEDPGETATQSPTETPTTHVDFSEPSQSSPTETAKQVEPLDSADMLVSQSDPSSSRTEQETKKMAVNQPSDSPQGSAFSPASPVHCVTPPVSCLTPPVVSLSPPCLTPPPPILSPPPCLTPPSHCLSSPMLSTVSPATSFSSPTLSFSPTSSCLSSPPYLTPPMLSLSPTPLCLTPPSPCLSPPLLCLTPPVESEDLVPQVSSDMEPLILNTDSDEQIKESSPQPGVPLLQLEVKKEHEYISSLPQVTEPVSFPITIPSSTSHVLPHSQSECPGESASPEATEAANSVPENKEAPEVTTDTSEQCDSPQASDSVPAVEVLAESMYGDFEAAMDHLRYRLIATRNPEEIRGGGLLKYSNLLVRDYRPASETQIKTLERYMCSRFFIDFPDVQEQQRKILSYLKNHFIGEERSKYQYLMTLRRVVDDSTVCLMGHERRQTLNMITVLALKVLGEQNIIPNTDHVTCFYQPAPYLAEHTAPYLAEPSYCSYYIPQGGSALLYQPYPLHLHPQTGLV